MAIQQINIKRQRVTTIEVEFVSLTTIDGNQHDVADQSLDPYEVLRYRTKLIAEGLGVSEPEAERILLGKVLA